MLEQKDKRPGLLIILTIVVFLATSFPFCFGNTQQCDNPNGHCVKETMWAASLSGFGEPADVLSFSDDFPKPFPVEDEVLVKLDARPIHPSDLLFIRGLYAPHKNQFPQVPGAEGTGVIEAVGDKVTEFKVGDRVTFWHSYETEHGTWAEYSVVPSRYLISVPEGLSPGHASQLILNPLTMIGIMEQFGDVKPGEWVLQNAANSACGKFLIQYLKNKGVKTINVVRHSESVEGLKALGADEVIALDAEEMKARVMEITEGEGVKYAIDCVWAQGAGPEMVDTLAPMGKMISFGVLGGFEETFSVIPLLFGMRSVQGFFVTPWAQNLSQAEIQELLAEVATWLKDGTIELPTEEFEPRAVLDAVVHSETPKKSRKTVIIG
mmetsp:Transcript_20743/g.26815  ORF Transcript_20743/g.26815 Transcript_20743/m.26815 type:complete len:379 (+) Transcript_20743:98-1234(+)